MLDLEQWLLVLIIGDSPVDLILLAEQVTQFGLELCYYVFFVSEIHREILDRFVFYLKFYGNVPQVFFDTDYLRFQSIDFFFFLLQLW